MFLGPHFRNASAIAASGDDKIPTKFIIMAADVIAPYHILLYIFLKVLKIAEIIPIYKFGQKDNVNNYRRIYLLSSFCKVGY